MNPWIARIVSMNPSLKEWIAPFKNYVPFWEFEKKDLFSLSKKNPTNTIHALNFQEIYFPQNKNHCFIECEYNASTTTVTTISNVTTASPAGQHLIMWDCLTPCYRTGSVGEWNEKVSWTDLDPTWSFHSCVTLGTLLTPEPECSRR